MLGSAEMRTESSRLHVLMNGPQNSHLKMYEQIHLEGSGVYLQSMVKMDLCVTVVLGEEGLVMYLKSMETMDLRQITGMYLPCLETNDW